MSAIVITNARVRTMDPGIPRCEALAVRDGRVLAVGRHAEVTGAAGPGAEVIDAGGRTVLPGFIDPHNHLLSTAESLASADARYPDVASAADLVAVIAEQARRTPPGQWIRAFGMDDAKFPGGRPSRWDLDEATTEHPVIVYHVSGHHAVVNSAALAWRGITADVPDPAGGAFLRDEGGRLTGMVLDSAMELLLPTAVDIGCHGPNFHTDLPAEQLLSWLAAAGEAYLSAGLTTVCDPQVSRRELTIYRAAHAAGTLPVRTVCMPLSHMLDDLTTLGLAGPFGDDMLRLGAMKFYCDGTLLGGTALFSEPYGEGGQFTGSTYHRPERLTDLVRRAAAAGWQVGVHTQGDLAMAYTLDAIKAAVAVSGDDARPRIEHCGHPTPGQVREFAALGVIPVNQPNFLHDSGRDFVRRLGERRAHRLQPMREEIDGGLRPVLSSDSFVSSLRPMETVANAVRRRTREGDPIGADQAVTLDEALRAHTADAAYALRMEDRIGSLTPGKLADVVVLDHDLDRVGVADLAGVNAWLTLLGGRVVHRS
ncbi:amidohydrolase [Microbispora hainanensis]|uniref:Amidohydrolase n=1 Tax=Microbispora hainanensis TaxID=568844 RepID=A0ABZ1SNE5_9ACTN|nr:MULTISPECIES: amidohydrolase [Microbispora]NJP28266.1 amidohydrolase [Microbispora sp. CL1-1]TQS09273.1 amidohydrolase [Microbispora sp. SCL1-1]